MKFGMRILLVDDERELRESIAHILSLKGHEVKESDSGSEALALFKDGLFPLVISDILMDGMSGIELLEKVKRLRPETEVILITGYASIETTISALRHGAFDYLAKNYDMLSSLPKVVERAGEKIRRAEEHRMMLENQKKMNAMLEHTQNDLKKVTAFDELTGLYNSRRFHEVLAGEVGRSASFKRKFTLVMFAVDDGVLTNAPSGGMRRAGFFPDMARVVTQRLRKCDVIARYKENMIAILLPETERAGADRVMENIYQLVADIVPCSRNRTTADIITGAAQFPDDGADGPALIRHVLEALKTKRAECGVASTDH